MLIRVAQIATAAHRDL